ncbi:MAG: TIGR03619 family F420-dependent LLM class oxidoreductase [Acidimicrobiia bacterium]|nr:TIGR03619 family F420-dependent LLM class oxidoreductase [Acidimicrobiia bacterium]
MEIGISLPVRELQDDLRAIVAFARGADELGFTHLRVPDLVLRPEAGHLHEPLLLLAYIAAVTERIELVPSVIVSPSRQTALLAKQATELDLLSGGRTRLGVGVGGSKAEYAAMGHDFHTRGARLEEQIELLRLLWSEPTVTFSGRWDSVTAAGLNPRPTRSIPLWIGAGRLPGRRVLRRIGRLADGWFVLCGPDEFEPLAAEIRQLAEASGREPSAVGAEASVAVVGDAASGWRDRVEAWRQEGLTHLCLRTLGAELTPDQHLAEMQRAASELR